MPEFSADGSVEHVLGVTHDVTAMRQLEQALRDADRRKDEFIAMLGHELRGPLAPLRNGVLLLQKMSAVSSTAQGIYAMMDRQLQHLVRLVDDLLDVSRISTGKLALQRSRIALQTVVDHAVEASLPMIVAAAQQLERQVAEQPVWIDGDLTRLAQVLTNLLINAAKYTPRGGRIVLFAGVEGADAVMRVSDSGRGIAPSMQLHIFDLFTQIDGPRDHIQAGLGIGLALVRQLLQLHGGDVECESAGVGQGSTFTVRLPMIAPAPEAGP